MPTMIAVITQYEDANPTMALPLLDSLLVAQIPAPAHALRPAKGHFCENSHATAHMRKVRNKKQSNKKESKTNNSKKGWLCE